MSDHKGIRTPTERLSDFWASLDIWTRYGLSFVGALAIILAIYALAGLVG